MRNKTVQKLLEQYGEDGEEKQIIDSSQVAGANVIRKAMKKWKANKIKKALEEGKPLNQMKKIGSKRAMPLH